MDTTESIVVALLCLVALCYLGAAYRHKRAISAMDIFSKEYSLLCDDDAVSVDVLENMRNVFTFSCGWCAATTICITLLLYKYSPEYRRTVDGRSSLANKNLRPETARKILRTYEALFDYACYAVPFVGVIIRLLIRHVGLKAQKAVKPGVFLVAGRRVVAPLWSSFALT